MESIGQNKGGLGKLECGKVKILDRFYGICIVCLLKIR